MQQASDCIIGRDYPGPIVRHEDARQRTLARYGKVRVR
jgi:deoxyribodipyrimidine photolyase